MVGQYASKCMAREKFFDCFIAVDWPCLRVDFFMADFRVFAVEVGEQWKQWDKETFSKLILIFYDRIRKLLQVSDVQGAHNLLCLNFDSRPKNQLL